MTIYAIIYLAIYGTALLCLANLHGKPKPIENWNFFKALGFNIPIWVLLYLGEFFN